MCVRFGSALGLGWEEEEQGQRAQGRWPEPNPIFNAPPQLTELLAPLLPYIYTLLSFLFFSVQREREKAWNCISPLHNNFMPKESHQDKCAFGFVMSLYVLLRSKKKNCPPFETCTSFVDSLYNAQQQRPCIRWARGCQINRGLI